MTEAEKDKMIENLAQTTQILENRLEMSEADKRKLEQENNRLELLLETANSDVVKYKHLLANRID